MDMTLWAIQIILSIKLITVSFTHGLPQSQPTIQEAIQKLGKFSRPLLFIISVCTFIGAVILALAGVLRLPNSVISITAIIMAIMLLFSIFFHVKSREKPKIFVSVVLLVFAAFVAYGRWELYP
jgi:uncharacterized membrane protein (UPF0136 family)